MEPHQYRPLDHSTQEIRIAELAPGQGSSSLLNITLKHVNLLETPRYWTLSYTWGSPFDGLEAEWDDPAAKRLIRVDGKNFYVRWNLEAALRFLAFGNVSSIWIDAICINQENEVEKAQQVQMMGQIYENAVTTFAWLGPSSSDSSRAIGAISRFRHSWDSRPGHLRQQSLTPSELQEYRIYAQDDLDDTAGEDIRAISQLLKRSWFRRVWIVQEVSLSKEVVLCWGEGGLSYWGWLDSAVRLLSQHLHSIFMLKDHFVDMPYLVEVLFNIANSATWFRRTNDLRRLIQNNIYVGPLMVLEALGSFEASDNRDRVYAGLSLSPDLGTIKVDYSISEAVVFRIVTRAFIEKNNDLSILALMVPSEMDNLPSWAIDFTKPASASLASHRMVGAQERLYRAGGSLQPDVGFKNGSSMTIYGVPLGALSFVGSIPREHSQLLQDTEIDISQLLASKKSIDLRPLQEAWLGGWLYRQREIPGQYTWTGEEICDAFARTICCDFMFDGNSAPRRLGSTVDFTEDFWSLLLRSGMDSTLVNRTFAATSLGHFCLVQKDARAGDVIVVASGAETPYLLRPTNNGRYRFAGCSYVHGFMDGEVVKWTEGTEEGRGKGVIFEVV